MFFLRIGVCEVLVHAAVVNKLYPGAGFGEVAMVMGVRRTSTVRCCGFCELSVLNRRSVDQLMKEYPVGEVKALTAKPLKPSL